MRLIRALEIIETLKCSVCKDRPLYDALWVGVAPPMKKLEKKIATRLYERIRQGMVAEAKRLHACGLSYKRMEELGLEYRSLASFLQGKITRMQMIEELKSAIRRYAKRQIMYWKRNKDIVWFEKPEMRKIPATVTAWLKK